MSEAATRAKVGEESAGQACSWCKVALTAEEDAATCGECGALHHEACWDGQLGCAKEGCINAPLKRLDTLEPAKATPGQLKAAKPKRRPRTKICVDCAQELDLDEEICDSCFAINTPDGLYHGPRTNAPGASQALMMAIVGVFFCAPILSPKAISNASKVKEEIRRDPRLSGEGMATAAQVIGALGLVFWIIALFSRLSATGR
jgi:hypothetical protein